MSQNCFAIVQLLFVLFTVCSLFIATTDGCYFRNCPIGGKRATPMSEQGSNQKPPVLQPIDVTERIIAVWQCRNYWKYVMEFITRNK
uniref:Cephalotocin-del n=1 Tax=Octopus vulgaris TaxID=6645 RepID=Q76DM9_OCTVU|nr:cephalotocin-del [Octopus vulgaris]